MTEGDYVVLLASYNADGVRLGILDDVAYGKILEIRHEETRFQGQSLKLRRYYVEWHGVFNPVMAWMDSGDVAKMSAVLVRQLGLK